MPINILIVHYLEGLKTLNTFDNDFAIERSQLYLEGCERVRTHIFGAVEGTKLLKIVLTVFSP